MAKSAVTCAALRAAIEAGDYARWTGLPACPVADVAAAWKVPATAQIDGSYTLGAMTGAFRWLTPGDALRNLRMWWHSPERVALIDIENPRVAQPGEALLAALGEPAARFDLPFDVLVYKGGERVYPERGLTVYVDPSSNRVLRVALYAPTTLDGWKKSLRLDLSTREFPLDE